ncbi:Uncharacterised protein [Staphylococcus aureus]|uniref:Uncharacterized protein n=1 Tax=Staphylococcus aureus TaxID=1280 RepID=A0A2X2K6U4_STAAU|nr:Uncharacterised protein [Staphylococcus aureus]
MSQPLRKLHTYSTYLSFTLISRKLFNATKIVAPISERIAIQRVSQPGITNSKAIILIPMANVMFALMIFSVFLLSLTANGSLLKSSPINAISAVSMAVSVPAPPIAMQQWMQQVQEHH